MSSKPFVIVLIIVCLALSGGLYMRHSKAVKIEADQASVITTLSNRVVKVEESLNEQKQVNLSLESDLTQKQDDLKKLTNQLQQTAANLVRTEADAKKAAEAASAEMAKREARITELEGQRDDLTRRMTELNGSITTLEGEIQETQRKLAASEGDRTFLMKELKRMQQEKNDLEKQFNDLAMLRDQVRRLRDELSISRRLDWLRRGIYGTPRGAEKLLQSSSPTNRNYDLNVELKRDGSVQVNPGATNAPANPR
jgi:chromosome segregation ATPase